MAFCIEIPSLDKISEAAAQFVSQMLSLIHI